MTYVFDNPARFKDDTIEGFARAYSRYVERVPSTSGFLRSGGPTADKVALVVGGGSGHYPSYAGIVGTGLADGCVLGDVFTSPSAEQIYRVAKAADGGAGVVLAFGNYAGDRLNFGAAAERLQQDGIDARIVYVTDDVASAPTEARLERRGIAGTLTVYKIGGAAADRGLPLAEVESLMQRANGQTNSFGVAFAGCTLPGAEVPLFTVEQGQMEFGLGIHGEPGVRTSPLLPARDVAETLFAAVVADAPSESTRVALLVNGLGGIKYEELFVLFRHIGDLAEAHGMVLVLPEVGELVTSLDMSGCSLSITWLDEELESLWSAACDTAAFRRDLANAQGGPRHPQAATNQMLEHTSPPALSQDAGEETLAKETTQPPRNRDESAIVRQVLLIVLETLREHQKELGRIDAVAGDGDHGTGMVRGAEASLNAVQDLTGVGNADIQRCLEIAGDAWADSAGGTSGILWGTMLRRFGAALTEQAELEPGHVAQAARDAVASMQSLGGAKLGDKTMLDSLSPFVQSLELELSQGQTFAEAMDASATVASQAADQTAGLAPKVGRARPMAERSVGTPDAGAISAALIAKAIAASMPSLADTWADIVDANPRSGDALTNEENQ